MKYDPIDLQDALRDIRTKCRLAMNGIASTSMRERGLDYKLNFGLLQEQIKRIAEGYEPNKELAEALWAEDTRELKILATLVYPIEEMTEDTATKWMSEIQNQEMREQMCINLFQRLPFASQMAKEWANNADASIRTTGYWLLVRLFITKKHDANISLSTFDSHIWEDIIAKDLFQRNASLSVLKHLVRQSKDEAENIIRKLEKYKDSQDAKEQEAYNSITFEYEFMYS